MRKNLLVTSIITTLAVMVILLSFSMISVVGAPTTVNFTVNLTLSGNANPSIQWVQSGVSANPTESTTTTVWIAFNASDANGYGDIDYSTAQIILTLAGEAQRTSSTCNNYNNDSLIMQFNCSINMQYYDLNGAWTINASVDDLSASKATDTSTTMSYGSLQAVRGNLAGITFGNVTLSQNTGASNDPLILNNTGNQNFTQINLTAYDLVGTTTPSQYIPASNLYVNASLDNFGDQLSNNTMVALTNGTLARDFGGSEVNRNLYFWVNVPGSGLSNQDYVASTDWQIEVFP